MPNAQARVVSLFSGCGGFDLGFQNLGYSTIGAFDLDSDATTNYKSNFSSPVYQVDLTQGIPNAHELYEVDVMIAGPPCQGFSTAGKREFDDRRNHLLPLTATLAQRIKPKVLVVENVRGALSGKHASYWERMEHTMRDCGYQTKTLAINTTHLGLPQTRNRVLLFAWNTGRSSGFPVPQKQQVSLREVLSGASRHRNHLPQFLKEGTSEWKIANRITQGQKLCNVRAGQNAVPTWEIPEVYGKTSRNEKTILELVRRLRRTDRSRAVGDADPVSYSRLSEAFGPDFINLVDSLISKGFLRKVNDKLDLVGTFNGKFRRLSWNQPSYTVDTRFGSPRYFLHPTKHRGFTVREAARIQGFPDDFVFHGTAIAQYRVIGNAVPVPLAEFAAEICKTLLGAS